jgi:hypothetical protein
VELTEHADGPDAITRTRALGHSRSVCRKLARSAVVLAAASDQLDQLGTELDRHVDRNRWVLRLKAYSAETIHGKEAEFIRERLPRKAPRARAVLLLLVVGVIVWWLTR